MSRLPWVELTAMLDGRVVARDSFRGPGLRCTIGRADDCELRVEETGVSRRHCAVFAEEGNLVLEDLGSVNGVFFAGKRVARRALFGTGEFSICGVVVRYRAEVAERPEPTKGPSLGRASLADLTMQVNPLQRLRDEQRTVVRPALRAHLARAEEADASRYVLLHKATFVVGSSSRADFVVEDEQRIAVVFVRGDEAFEVLDVSHGGKALKINGKRSKRAVLVEDDELEICGQRFFFRSGLPSLGKPATKRWVARPRKPE